MTTVPTAASLPPDGRTTPEAKKAWATAQGFESVFLSTLLSPMFEGLQGDGPLGDEGAGSEMWRGMLVENYAEGFAKAGGLGLSQSVYRELIAIQEGSQR
jgi:Rod binding domain-containing protein